MKKSKKIMMTMVLGLSISALGFGVSANLDSNVAYAKKAQEINEEDQRKYKIDLSFRLLRKVGKNKEYNTNYKAEYVYINGAPYKLWHDKQTDIATYKRGERVNFKLKETDEPGAPFVAEGEFDVPLKGYRNNNTIEIKLREIDQAKPEKEAPAKPEKETPEKSDKAEANKKSIEGLRAAKKQAEVTLNACHLLIKFTPETIKSVRAELDQLMVKQEKLIKQANNLLAKYE